MKLTEMRQLLAERNIQLTKALGQNFLHDGNQLRRMVAAAELQPADPVLEIGPGLGPLTELLLEGGRPVLAIEKDARLVSILRERLADQPGLTLVHADALDYLEEVTTDWSPWKIVANLPYSVASVMLVQLALAATCPARLVVTLQLEVGLRLVAAAGSKDYGILPLLVRQRYAPELAFQIPATCFHPAPEVDSACVVLNRHPDARLSAPERAVFVLLVKAAFAERRKMMLKLLKRVWDETQLEAAFAALGLSPTCRAETVTQTGFEELARRLPAPGGAVPASPAAATDPGGKSDS